MAYLLGICLTLLYVLLVGSDPARDSCSRACCGASFALLQGRSARGAIRLPPLGLGVFAASPGTWLSAALS